MTSIVKHPKPTMTTDDGRGWVTVGEAYSMMVIAKEEGLKERDGKSRDGE